MHKSPKVILNRTYDANDEGVVFSTLDAAEPFSVRVPHDLLERFKLPDRGDGSGISFGDEPVEAQMLVLDRYIDVPTDPVHRSSGQVKW